MQQSTVSDEAEGAAFAAQHPAAPDHHAAARLATDRVDAQLVQARRVLHIDEGRHVHDTLERDVRGGHVGAALPVDAAHRTGDVTRRREVEQRLGGPAQRVVDANPRVIGCEVAVDRPVVTQAVDPSGSLLAPRDLRRQVDQHQAVLLRLAEARRREHAAALRGYVLEVAEQIG